MRKALLLTILPLAACVSRKGVDNSYEQILASHPKPIKVFSVGAYRNNTAILILTDSLGHYFTVEQPRDARLKVGSVYIK
jgi:hypothetical protein